MVRLPLLVLFGIASAASAQAPAAPIPAGIIAAPPNPLGDLATRQRTEQQQRCPLGGGDDIVVCGRLARRGDGYRVPYRPEPGGRVRLIAGEVPSATGAMSADRCIRLCEQPIMLDLLHPGTIARGIDRILSGD